MTNNSKICKAFGRYPDMVIGEAIDPYLLRWWIIPRNRFFNIYLHKFMRSDDDRALHDHPWAWNLSLIIKGSYIEHMPNNRKTYGQYVYKIANETIIYKDIGCGVSGDSVRHAPEDFETVMKMRKAWHPIFRLGSWPHRVELLPFHITSLGHKLWVLGLLKKDTKIPSGRPVWTIFITGRTVREWGFFCPQGWKHWKKFVSVRKGGNSTGAGCDD